MSATSHIWDMDVRHDNLPAWLDLDFEAYQPGTLKLVLTGRGINGRGWRLYLDFGDALFKPLENEWFQEGKPYRRGHNAVTYLRLLQACEMDVPPPPALARSLPDWEIPAQRLALVSPQLLRATWRSCAQAEYAGKDLEAHVEDEILPVARWYFGAGLHRDEDPKLLKAGWASLARRYDQWLAESRRAARGDWPGPLRWAECDGLRFESLDSEAALREEGRAMRHCVGEYGDICLGTSLRVFSVRNCRSGLRVATISVEPARDGTWSIDQLKGPGNAEVDKLVWRASGALLSLL